MYADTSLKILGVSNSGPSSKPLTRINGDLGARYSLAEIEEGFTSLVHFPEISSSHLAAAKFDYKPYVTFTEDPNKLAPPELKVTDSSPVPDVCRKFFHARAASRGGFDRMVITTPNANVVWAYPRQTPNLETYDNGRWGLHEYSTYPQDLCPGRWHVACIPLPRSDYPSALWRDLDPTKDWEQDRNLGLQERGSVTVPLKESLVNAARRVSAEWEKMKVPIHVMKYARFLLSILRNYVDRMRYLPAPRMIAITVAAHVQRTSLELLGLKTYMDVVVPRLGSGEDYSRRVLKVVGAFVRDGSDAANLHRVGIPVWYFQPLTHQLPVWQVVDTVPPSTPLKHMNVPFSLHIRAISGVERGIILAVSPHLAGRCLAAMPLPEPCDTPDEPPAKRPRVEEAEVQGQPGKGFAQNGTPLQEPKKKKTQRGRRGGKAKDDENPAQLPVQPSKTYLPSPFTVMAPCWESALKAVSPLPPLRISPPALYFYPPPFLLDTICDNAGISACDEQRAHLARRDEKAHRYLHNYARIGSYLRARLLDPSLSNEPLTITEWRVVLFGDYRSKEHSTKGSGSTVKRAKRRMDSRNEASRMLNRTAGIPSYTLEDTADYDGEHITALTVTSSPSLRHKILWKCHEINFRAELLALDAVLTQKPNWWEIQYWAREEAVSVVWGPPSCAVTVVPRSDEDRVFRWAPTASDPRAGESVMALASVLSQWPGCPPAVAQVAARDIADEEFASVQEMVVQFYVRTFVKTFNRLPIPPVPFRKDVG